MAPWRHPRLSEAGVGPEQGHLPELRSAHARVAGQHPDEQQTGGRGWTHLQTAGRGLLYARDGPKAGSGSQAASFASPVASLSLEQARSRSSFHRPFASGG